MTKIVAVVFGGYSAEWIISEKSAKVVFKHLNRNTYRPFLVHIEQVNWSVVLDNGIKLPIDRNDFSFVLDGSKISFDVVFNAIHGTPGEDGTLAGDVEMLKIPFTSAGVLASSLSFSKSYCNGFLRQFDDVNIATSLLMKKGDPINSIELIEKVGLPCFVKPNNAGSSFGISKVNSKEDLKPAIEKAFEHDNEVIIEQFIDGTEVSNGVYQKNGEIRALALTEIVSANEFFDYNAKYEGASEEITPARVAPEVAQLVRETTKKVYKRLRLKGMSRVDYIIQNGKPFLIEVNTIPGLSEESIYPQQVVHAGMTLQDFFGLLTEEAC